MRPERTISLTANGYGWLRNCVPIWTTCFDALTVLRASLASESTLANGFQHSNPSGTHHVRAQLGVLEISSGDHYTVNIVSGQHVLRIFIGFWIEIERFFCLSHTSFPRQTPYIANCDHFHQHLLRGQLRRVYMTFAVRPAPKLREPDAIVAPRMRA